MFRWIILECLDECEAIGSTLSQTSQTVLCLDNCKFF